MSMKLISTTTLGSNAASIEFTSIPATYTDLLLVVSLRVTNNLDNFLLELNSSTSNFTLRTLLGDGSAASSGTRTDSIIQSTVNQSVATASTFSNASFYFPNYAGSTNKSFSVDGVTENNGVNDAFNGIIAGLWSNTAAITGIKLTARNSGNFVTASSASLYGITKGTDGVTTAS